MAKKEKIIKSIVITLHGGPLNGKQMEVAYPVRDSYLLDMGRSLYEKRSSTDFDFVKAGLKFTI